MPCYKMAAAAPALQRSGRSSVRLDSEPVDGPSATSAIGFDHTRSAAGGRRPGFKFNPFSGTASAALFASLALCLVLICAYSYVARRRAISGTRRRFLQRVRDLDLVPGRPSRRAEQPPLPRVATARPAAAVGKTLPPAVHSSGSPGDCPVCLEPLRGGGDVAASHACGHVFHARCIEPWLDRRDSCPVCRCTVSCGGDHRAVHSSGPPGDCPVCLEPLRGGGDVAASHACGHVFHARCIEPWLDRRDSCPVCRCTVSCGGDHRANEAATAAAGGGARHLRENVVVVITAEAAASSAGSDDDEMLMAPPGTTRSGAMTVSD